MTRDRRERGSSLPETAIVLAVLLSLMFAIIDFGRALYTYGFVAQLAREGARWAIVRGSTCSQNVPDMDHCPAKSTDMQPYIQSLNEGATNASSFVATLQWPSCPGGAAGTNKPGCVAEVTVTYPFTFMLPFLPSTGITMSSTSQMVISQ